MYIDDFIKSAIPIFLAMVIMIISNFIPNLQNVGLMVGLIGVLVATTLILFLYYQSKGDTYKDKKKTGVETK